MGRWHADRLMKELGLVSCQQPVHRDKRGGDVTYIRTGKRRAYPAVVPGLFARKPAGRAMSFSPDNGLTLKAPEMAWETSGNPAGVCSTALRTATVQAGCSGSDCGDTGSGKV